MKTKRQNRTKKNFLGHNDAFRLIKLGQRFVHTRRAVKMKKRVQPHRKYRCALCNRDCNANPSMRKLKGRKMVDVFQGKLPTLLMKWGFFEKPCLVFGSFRVLLGLVMMLCRR